MTKLSTNYTKNARTKNKMALDHNIILVLSLRSETGRQSIALLNLSGNVLVLLGRLTFSPSAQGECL
jgi:hypothetical protein